jgi:hypothetical protein
MKIKEKFMVSIFSVAVVLLVSMIGVGWTSYKIGIKQGVADTIDLLLEEGILELETDKSQDIED